MGTIEKELERELNSRERIEKDLKKKYESEVDSAASSYSEISEKEKEYILLKEKERKKQEKNLNAIKKFQNNQNINVLLKLMKRFNNDSNYFNKILEVVNEDILIKAYFIFKNEFQIIFDNINMIFENDYNNNNPNYQRKIILMILCNEKITDNNCDLIVEKLIHKNCDKKELIFNILLDYNMIFGNDIHFNDFNLYKQFVEYSLKIKKYKKSLEYLKYDIIQLEILNEKREEIYKSGEIVEFNKLNNYDKADILIADLINYEKSKGKKFVFFSKKFWENYYMYYLLNETEGYKFEKIIKLYKLLLSYIELGQDETEYQIILEGKIHKLIEIKLGEIIKARDQLEFVFKNDPYYLYESEQRNPNIFKLINIFNLKNENDIKFFQALNFEKVYNKKFKNFLNIIINQIRSIQDFINIINLININTKSNKEEYINLLIKRYSHFTVEELTEKSFIIFFKKIIEYNQKINFETMGIFLSKFKKNNIYLEIFNEIKLDEDIKKQVIILTIRNLEILDLIDLIKKLNEIQVKDYLNNLNIFINNYADFFQLEPSDNLKLLLELFKNNLIPESVYLNKNKKILLNIFDKLKNYDDKKELFSETIFSEKEGIHKIFSKRFELFKLIEDDKFDSELEYKKLKDKYQQVEQNIIKAYKISHLLSLYYREALKEDINKINNIYKNYLNKEKNVSEWINKEEEIIYFIDKYEIKSNLIKEIKQIQLFNLIYEDFTEGDEITKFQKANKILDDIKIIFDDIQKGNQSILKKWQNKFKEIYDINEEIEKLINYYKSNNIEVLDNNTKKILIFLKKNIYQYDIQYILYFLKLFNSKETYLTNYLKEKNSELKINEYLNIEKMININNYLEEKKIYINFGKDDSSLIKLIRKFYNKENEVNFVKNKIKDSSIALNILLESTIDFLTIKDLLEFNTFIKFIDDIKEKITDEQLIILIRENLEKYDINKLLSIFEIYFLNFEKIIKLDSEFGITSITGNIYEIIKDILNNSQFKIELFKQEFIVYNDEDRQKDILIKNLNGLIQLKDKIFLNLEELYENKNKYEEKIKIKIEKIILFVKYVEQLEEINKYIEHLENLGCPLLINITVISLKDNIQFKLKDADIKYYELINKLIQFFNKTEEYLINYYKGNIFFRFIYGKQIYKLFIRGKKKKNFSSFIKYITNENSIEEIPLPELSIYDNNQYEKNIRENFGEVSKYINNSFLINNTYLKKLYNKIKIKDNIKGIYKCNIRKNDIELFILEIFLKLIGSFPLSQNILLANRETTEGEIYSFLYRSIKCRFNTLFIILICSDFHVYKINKMKHLLKKIIIEMKKENSIKDVKDLNSCILFLIQNSSFYLNDIFDVQELQELTRNMKEEKKEFNMVKYISINSDEYKIYQKIKIYTSDYCRLGKSYLFEKIKEICVF